MLRAALLVSVAAGLVAPPPGLVVGPRPFHRGRLGASPRGAAEAPRAGWSAACDTAAVVAGAGRDAAAGAVRRAKAAPLAYVPAACVALRGGPAATVVVACALAVTWQATLGDDDARRRARAGWQKDWKAHAIVTPLSAAFVGWFTNWVGVQMLFYPLEWKGLPPPPGMRRWLARLPSAAGDMPPFGWICGWQGIVPAKAPRMARDLVRVVTTRLVSVEETINKLDVDELGKRIMPCVSDLARSTFDGLVDVPTAGAFGSQWLYRFRAVCWGTAAAAKDALSTEHAEALKSHTIELARGVARDVRRFGAETLDLETLCVNGLTGPNVKELVNLFQRVGKNELALLVNSGATVGLALGIIQAVLQLCLARKYGGATEDKPQKVWVSLLGSALVGCITNWIALLWIFRPIEPQKVLFGLVVLCVGDSVTLQGCFLKRQKEVSLDFAKFFVRNILTSRNMLDDALFSGASAYKFTPRLRQRVSRFARGAAGELAPGLAFTENAALIDSATNQLRNQLPKHLPASVYEYADSAFDLESTISTRMAAMAPCCPVPAIRRDFERLLHPIFEEDEITLIAVGGLLGLAAAYLQLRIAGTSLSDVRRAVVQKAKSMRALARRLFRRPDDDPPLSTAVPDL